MINKLKIIKRRLRKLYSKRIRIPFILGRVIYSKYNSPFPGTFLSYIPDRYYSNLNLYLEKNINAFFIENNIYKWNKGNYINNSGDLSRFYFFNLIIDQLLQENIIGDAAELGVYKGNSAFLLQQFTNKINHILYLFDTFESFQSSDLKNSDIEADVSLFTDTSLEHVRTFLGDNKNVRFVKGYFPDSLALLHDIDMKFSIVHIDCDLEIPFQHALEFFYPRLVSGGFLVMHDYSSLSWLGAKKAIDTFFSTKIEKIIPIPDKSGTAVIRKF